MRHTPLTLEVTVISGEGLRLNRRQPVKKNAFVIIRSDSHNYRTTKMDTEGGSRPSWNEKFVVDTPTKAGFITVEVQCKTSLVNKVVGTARIPASDIVGGYTPESYLHFLSYRLRDANGERNGIINLSVRVLKVPEFVRSVSRPWLGTPVTPVVEKHYGGVVTGVPVWYSYSV